MQAFFVRSARNRETVDMQEIIDLISRKTLHWFSYVANVCWILLGIILSAILLNIENGESRFDFRCYSNGDKV